MGKLGTGRKLGEYFDKLFDGDTFKDFKLPTDQLKEWLND